jgi:PAS domain S-box-containing protein
MLLTETPHPAHPSGAGQPHVAVRPAPANIPSRQKKTNQTLRQTDQDLRQASQDKREFRQDARESRQDTRNVDQASRETSQDARKVDQSSREASQDLRESEQDLRESLQEALRSQNVELNRYRIIVENIVDYAIFMLDTEGRINSWSPGARNILGYTAEETLGRDFSLVFAPADIRAGEPQRMMEEAARTGRCATEGWRVRQDGSTFWSSGVLSAVRDETGKLTDYIRVARDMTEYKQLEDAQAHLAAGLEVRVRERTLQLEANMEKLRRKNAEVEASAQLVARELKEKEVLFREIHHRVKNNLQVVQSLLKMVVRELPPSEAREAIESMILRVRAMAIVHERLCQMPGLAGLSSADYLRDIFDGAIASYSIQPGRISFHLDAEDILLDLDHAIPFGMLANELLSNSLKHGFPSGRKGTISVSMHRVDGVARMVIQDNGIGLPVNFDAANCKSMGLKLANSLAHQLGGALLFTSKQGCRVEGDLTRL